MNRLSKKLLFMAAATTMWVAAFQPGIVSAQTSGIGGDGYTRLLWRATNGSISLWKLNPFLASPVSHVYGPYATWEPVAITTAQNSWTYVLWRNTNNSISLWAVDPNLIYRFSKQYGPYPGWIAETLSADTSGNGSSNLRLIWKNVNGQVSIWSLDSSVNLGRNAVYGPYFGYNPGPTNGAAVTASTPGATDPEAATAMKSAADVGKEMPK